MKNFFIRNNKKLLRRHFKNSEEIKYSLNDNQRSIVWRSVFLVFMITVMLVVTGVLVYSLQSVYINKNYVNLLSYNAESAAGSLVRSFNEFDRSKAKIALLSVDRRITFDEKVYNTNINQYTYIQNNDFIVSTYHDITSGANRSRLLLLIDCRDKKHLYYMPIGDMLDDLQITYCAIVTPQGAIVGSEIPLGTGLNESIGDIWNGIENLNGITATLENNEVCMFACAPISNSFYFVAIQEMSSVQKDMDSSLLATSLILALLEALILVGCTIFVISLDVKKLSKMEKTEESACFRVITDETGKVLDSDSRFRSEYGCESLFDRILTRSTVTGFKAGDNFWAVYEDRMGEEHIINFIAVKSSPRKFEFVGCVEDTFLSERNMDKPQEVIKDEATQFSLVGIEFEKRFALAKESNESVLLGIFEIQNTRMVQDTFGEEFTTKYQSGIYERIKQAFRDIHLYHDKAIGVMITGDKAISDIRRDLNEIMEKINRIIQIEYDKVLVSVTAGFALFDSNMRGADYAYLQRCARAAIKRAKVEVNDYHYYVYHESQKRLYARFFDYNFDIPQLLSNHFFEMQFQPQVNLTTGKVSGFESLFRIKKNANINISTYEFITYAERTGKMMLLGNFIFSESMKFAKRIQGKGAGVSLNVSPIQLLQSGFVHDFLELYNSYELQPGDICVEVTESFIMNDMNTIVKKLQVLHDTGIKIHLDDFGTSYSSLAYISKLPIDLIKIDKAFVDNILTDPHSQSITQFVIDLARDLNLSNLAECVESLEQMDLLRRMGCQEIQGYLTGRAMTEDDAEALLDQSLVAPLIPLAAPSDKPAKGDKR